MKKLLHNRASLIFLFLLGIIGTTNSQCVNCSANFPTGTFSTTSNSLVTLTNCVWGGEFSSYNVTFGETYTWTTCGGTSYDTQLTLYAGTSCGPAGTQLAYNDNDCGLQSTITWTATFTGQVRLLVSQFNCANNTTCIPLQWACLSCGVVPGCTDPTALNYNPAIQRQPLMMGRAPTLEQIMSIQSLEVRVNLSALAW